MWIDLFNYMMSQDFMNTPCGTFDEVYGNNDMEIELLDDYEINSLPLEVNDIDDLFESDEGTYGTDEYESGSISSSSSKDACITDSDSLTNEKNGDSHHNEAAVSPHNTDVIVEEKDVTDQDVILGRGGQATHRKGNKLHLQKCKELRGRYKIPGISNASKRIIQDELIDSVHERKGRFLQKVRKGVYKVLRVTHVVELQKLRKQAQQKLSE
jgi:hypothetical protein